MGDADARRRGRRGAWGVGRRSAGRVPGAGAWRQRARAARGLARAHTQRTGRPRRPSLTHGAPARAPPRARPVHGFRFDSTYSATRPADRQCHSGQSTHYH